MMVSPAALIRTMQMTDLGAVVAVEQLANPHPWNPDQFISELSNNCSIVELACYGAAVAGYLCSWLVVDELQIQNIATHPKHRRKGVAALLLAHRHARAKEAGAVVSLLEVRVGNIGAIRLYEQFGYCPTGIRKNYYSNGENAILMERQL